MSYFVTQLTLDRLIKNSDINIGLIESLTNLCFDKHLLENW